MSAVTLATLADEINYEHAHALEHAHAAVPRARRAGELLIQAKERCEHGEWLPWLKANCPNISERTAQAYMRVARKCLGDEAKADQLELLTLGEALEQLVEQKPRPAARSAETIADSATLFPELKSATAADLPKRPFDPTNFRRRLAELDENIDRAAARAFANFKVDTNGLNRFERAAAWMALRDTPPADIQLTVGCVTVGSIGETAAVALVESREHAPRELCSRCGGYRLLIDTATKRLVKCSACNGTSPNAGCKSGVNAGFLKVAA